MDGPKPLFQLRSICFGKARTDRSTLGRRPPLSGGEKVYRCALDPGPIVRSVKRIPLPRGNGSGALGPSSAPWALDCPPKGTGQACLPGTRAINLASCGSRGDCGPFSPSPAGEAAMASCPAEMAGRPPTTEVAMRALRSLPGRCDPSSNQGGEYVACPAGRQT